MFEKIQRRGQIEWGHLMGLSSVSRKLLVSYGLFLLTYPMLTVFLNAYLWRDSQEPLMLLLYNLGYFVALPLGFYINGWLLKYLPVRRLYFGGTILQGLGALLVVFLPGLSLRTVGWYGLMYGLGAGIQLVGLWPMREMVAKVQSAKIKNQS